MKKLSLLLAKLLDLKNLLNFIKSNHFVKCFDSQDAFTFYILHKRTKSIIHHCTIIYPTRDIAEWSATNYFHWFLQDIYSADDIIIGISSGIPEIIDNDNVRQPL